MGDAVLLGHSIGNDLAFLQPKNVLINNEIIDTYELASVFMPTASRYNLSGLAAQLGILLPATHRALDDARCTHAIFIKLQELALQLPYRIDRRACSFRRAI